MVSGSRIRLCDSVSGFGKICGNLLVSLQAWVMRFEGQGVLRKPADPRDHYTVLNTYGDGVRVCVCICAELALLSFALQESWPCW